MDVQSPILVSDLFAELHQYLMEMLRSLEPREWALPTVCSEWSVQDIVAHLLDGSLRRLSVQRDAYQPPLASGGFANDRELVRFIHKLNADWTQVARRFSPRVLTDLLDVAGKDICTLFETADPYSPATFPVSWAGEASSLMWFDVAREYTERWHHHRQIALATARETPIDSRRLYHPVLETFMRAMPYQLGLVSASQHKTVAINVTGEAGGRWVVSRRMHSTVWLQKDFMPVDAEVILPQAIAWQALTKRWDAETKLTRLPGLELKGDHELARHMLEMVSIMA